MATISGITEKLTLTAASSSYPTLGNSYKHSGHQIEYSPKLVRTGRNYYDSKAGIPKGERMSTAAEELAIQLGVEKAGQDPRKAGVFDDLFGKNDSHWYAWQWTETGLRVPKGRKTGAYEKDAHGRTHWARELLEGDKVVAEVLVPEGNGRVVVAWDKVSGLPKETDDIAFPHTPYTTHFWFNATPQKDSESGHYDVAVGRRSDWPRVEGGGCLNVDADCARSGANAGDGFRPVRGSAAKVEKNVLKRNPSL